MCAHLLVVFEELCVECCVVLWTLLFLKSSGTALLPFDSVLDIECMRTVCVAMTLILQMNMQLQMSAVTKKQMQAISLMRCATVTVW